MKIIRSIERMHKFSDEIRRKGQSIGFVPTMGALHKGHLSLVKRARRDNDKVILSIFVNPIQFGPSEDFKKYPRTLKQDIRLCRKEGVDVVFYPEADRMFPAGYKTYVNVEGLSDSLCGKERPGHFKGVATVVTKLFNIVSPDNAYFGQKDAQQAIVIRALARDLNVPLKIKVLATVRESSGLALSSRNAYLSVKEHADAAVLSRALAKAAYSARRGRKDAQGIIREIKRMIRDKTHARIEYVSVADPDTLKPLDRIKNKVLIALAVRFGKTRLIDNALVQAP